MEKEALYCVAEVVSQPAARLPEQRHIAFATRGWKAFAVAPPGAEATLLRWKERTGVFSRELAAGERGAQLRLRLAVSVDHRDEVEIEAFLPTSGRVMGTFDIRYPTVCQPVEIPLDLRDAEAMVQEGVGLRMTRGKEPLWLVTRTGDDGAVPEALLPHIMVAVDTEPAKEFMRRMLSLASLQPFGWLEGCVLDGLWDLERALGEARVRPVLEEHLSHYLDPDGRLRYINTDSKYYSDQIYGTEGTLPFAVLAQVWPDHPAIDLAVSFWNERLRENGLIIDGSVTAEGCYTVAYPLAVVGTQRSDERLCELAARQLRLRTERLFTGDEFFPQVRAGGARPFKSWGRGCVWYLLGHIRAAEFLGERDPRVLDDCRRYAAWVVQFQQEDGTWPAYVDEPAMGADTSTTAGLGAALARGVLAGILPEHYMSAAYRALEGAASFLTPDGFLGGSSPENKGGEAFQRSGYRAILQFTMGMMAQLVAALAMAEQRGAFGLKPGERAAQLLSAALSA